MTAMHDEHTLAAPYVLGALDTAERRVFEAHLAGCEQCRGEVRSLRRVADALAVSVPQRTPGPELRARVLSSILGTAAPPASVAVPHLHDRRAPPAWLPLAAMLALTVGLGAYAWQLHGRLSALEGRVADAEQRAAVAESQAADARREAGAAQLAMAVFAAPDVARIELAGLEPAPTASARALWSRDRGMVFTTANLPVLPAGRVYQVWVLTATTPPLSAGLVRPDAGGRAATVFATPADIPPPVAVAVTMEPEGGVPSPTGDMYLMGKPAN